VRGARSTSRRGSPPRSSDDGWAVKFDRFIVNLGTVEVGQAGAAPALEEPQFQVFDLAKASKGEGQLVVAGEVPAGSYSNTQYKIYPTDGDSVAGNVSDADMQLMQGSKYSVFVSGTATKDGVQKSFAWGFTTSTSYEGCESTGEIAEGRPGAVQLTVHGDHLFYDDLSRRSRCCCSGWSPRRTTTATRTARCRRRSSRRWTAAAGQLPGREHGHRGSVALHRAPDDDARAHRRRGALRDGPRGLS
jgi:hypothetical protein